MKNRARGKRQDGARDQHFAAFRGVVVWVITNSWIARVLVSATSPEQLVGYLALLSLPAVTRLGLAKTRSGEGTHPA